MRSEIDSDDDDAACTQIIDTYIKHLKKLTVNVQHDVMSARWSGCANERDYYTHIMQDNRIYVNFNKSRDVERMSVK